MEQATAADLRLAELEQAFANINFTSLALKSLDETIFERALQTIGEEFADQPLVRARLLETVASTWRGLGLLERALAPQSESPSRSTRSDDLTKRSRTFAPRLKV